MRFTIYGNPIAKPRMTQKDKWAKRDCVMRYRAWKEKALIQTNELFPHFSLDNRDPMIVSWVAYFPISQSWSEKKKNEMIAKPHRVKPDRDNIDKAILDALFESDQGIAGCNYMWKYWDDGNGPRIELEIF